RDMRPGSNRVASTRGLEVLLPLVFNQSLWLRRLGSMRGAAGILATIGAAVGPVAAGRIFDVSGSYAVAFGTFAAMWLAAALAIYACIPLEQEIARLSTSIARS